MVEAKRIPELEPTAVVFPYPEMGQSASGIACDISDGKFGPFKNQMFVGDQAHSTVMRVFLVAETATCLDGMSAFLKEIGAPTWTSNAQTHGEEVIEVMGRLCYKSFGVDLNKNLTKIREDNREYIANILSSRHGSVVEHAFLTPLPSIDSRQAQCEGL